MKIQLQRKNEAFHFEATNEQGQTVQIDAAPDIGGVEAGVRPMQMLLMALGGCSGIDVCLILKRQRQTVKDIKINIEGTRQTGHEPNLFETIHVVFELEGDLNIDKTNRAVQLSMDKYCSVAKTLEKTAAITYSVSINGKVVGEFK